MELDPYTLQQIISRIEQQMRCPQCGKRVPVDFPSVRLAGDDFVILQLKCETCDAYIVLHAAVQGAQNIGVQTEKDKVINESSALGARTTEVEQLRGTLEGFDGSFENLFGKKTAKKTKKEEDTGTDTIRIV